MALSKLERANEDLLEKRGEGTKHALLMAGLEIFGEYGLKGATVRMIADKAKANIAAIPYYFGSKEGLYTAVVSYITSQVSKHLKDASEDIKTTLEKDNITKAEALAAYQRIIADAAQMLVESDEPKAWAQIIMREQANPTEAFDIFYNGHVKKAQDLAEKCVSIYLGVPPSSLDVKIRVHAITGQLLGFVVSRESLLRTLGTKKLGQAHVKAIHRILAMHVEACLNTPLISDDTPKGKEI